MRRWILGVGTIVGFAVLLAFGVHYYLLDSRKRVAEWEAASAELTAARAAANRNPEELRAGRLAEIWDEFDRLRGPNFRTREMLTAYLLKANQVAVGLSDDERTRILDTNAAAFRIRLPEVLVAGERGRALGATYNAIVPSDDTGRCAKLAAAWSKGQMRQLLTNAGYVAIQCPKSPGQDEWVLR